LSTNNEKAKTDFLEACSKDYTRDTCERMWNDAKAGTKDANPVYDKKVSHDESYSAIVKSNEMKDVRIERLEEQLRQANTLLQRVNDLKKAEDEADKERLVIDIMNSSNYTKDMLISKSHDELKTIADALIHTEKGFASIAADAEQTRSAKDRKLTVGEWDPETKTWKGGR